MKWILPNNNIAIVVRKIKIYSDWYQKVWFFWSKENRTTIHEPSILVNESALLSEEVRQGRLIVENLDKVKDLGLYRCVVDNNVVKARYNNSDALIIKEIFGK